MEPGALAKLVAELLVAIQAISGHPVPATAPVVAFVPQPWLQAQACDRPCRVYGWFPPGRTVYLDDRLDPLNDKGARSILVHELVHFVQQEAGMFAPESTCESWLERERQAYDVQVRWLARVSAPRDSLRRFGLYPGRLRCREPAGSSPEARVRE